MMINLDKLSYEELEQLSKACTEEMACRSVARQIDLWNNLQNALDAYLAEFDCIEIDYEVEDRYFQTLCLRKNKYNTTPIGTIELL